MSACLLHSW